MGQAGGSEVGEAPEGSASECAAAQLWQPFHAYAYAYAMAHRSVLRYYHFKEVRESGARCLNENAQATRCLPVGYR